MSLDIRLPIALLFLALGLVLAIFGLVSGPAIYRVHSLGLNINLVWGGALILFGLVMLGLSFLHRRGRPVD